MNLVPTPWLGVTEVFSASSLTSCGRSLPDVELKEDKSESFVSVFLLVEGDFFS